jgi:hypothetical protein
MSGFVHPPWSGFSGPDPSAFSAAGDARLVAGHEIERLILGQAAATTRGPASGEASPKALWAAAPPLPVTSASPRPHKALIP